MDNIRIKNIFAAVFEKKVLDPLLAVLDPKEVKFWGTEGSVKYLKSKGFDAQSVVSGFDFDGRLKTIDKKVFAAVLADRSNKRHLEELIKLAKYSSSDPSPSGEGESRSSRQARTINNFEPIDLVVVDLYKPDSGNFPESMDIGGQAIIRAAIKNYKYEALAFDAESILDLVEELKAKQGRISIAFRKAQAKKAAKFIAERTKLEAELFDHERAE